MNSPSGNHGEGNKENLVAMFQPYPSWHCPPSARWWYIHLPTALACPGPIWFTIKEYNVGSKIQSFLSEKNPILRFRAVYSCLCYVCGIPGVQGRGSDLSQKLGGQLCHSDSFFCQGNTGIFLQKVPAGRLYWVLASVGVQPGPALFPSLQKWRLMPYCGHMDFTQFPHSLLKPLNRFA